MVRGLVRTENYLDKGQGDGNRRKENKNFNDVRDRPPITLKLFLTSAVLILIVSLFTFTGMVIFLNLNSGNNCRKGCINVHIIPYLRSSLNQMISSEDFNENDIDNSFDFIVNELKNDERRRFTITEIYPFWKWWKNQTDLIKLSVRSLIDEGRMEIAGGGWCTPDEAVVHYRSFIDQFTWGLRRLEEIAGRKISPDVSFLMDNRGHSKEIAALLKEMGFQGVMLGGISPMEQCSRRAFLKMEFIWSDGDTFGIRHGRPNLFASILDERSLKLNEYFWDENPVIDVEEFSNMVVCLSQGYATNNVFIPIGGNFQFDKLKNTFNVIESIMKLTKSETKYKLNVDYSTPSIYFKSIGYGSDHWPRSNGEFLPYIRGKSDYWTGYYSLRSSLKYVQRLAERFLQVMKQLTTLSNSQKEVGNTLNSLRESVGLSQHHEAATSGEAIVYHFQDLLIRRMEEAADAANRVLRKLTFKGNRTSKIHYESCLKLNVSECSVTETSSAFILTVYNPSSRVVDKYIRVPVGGNNYVVRSGDGQFLKTQIVSLSSRIRSIPGRESKSEKELLFRATKIPALGFKSYFVSAINGTSGKSTRKSNGKKIKLVLNESTGKVSAVERNGKVYHFRQELMVYKSWFSSTTAFRPVNQAQPMGKNVSIRLLNHGELLTEYEQNFGSWASQTMRIYQDEDFVEYNWVVGPVPVSLFESKEIVSSFATNVQNGFSFYLDSNGRGFQQNFNGPQMENENIGERIARNYRPINSRIAIADHNCQIHVFSDRVQGGSAPFQGQIELMLHRKFTTLAALGKPDISNERAEDFAVGQHWMFLGSSKDTNLKSTIENFSSTVGWETWQFFGDASNISFEEWRDSQVTEFSGLKSQLPRNVRILTLDPLPQDEILLRIENIGEDGCGRVRINLQELLSGLVVMNATQVSLTGNDFKKNFENPRWSYGDEITDYNVFIYPNQIRTFILAVQPLP